MTCRCGRTASNSRVAPIRTARPSGSATSISRPRRLGAVLTTAPSTSAATSTSTGATAHSSPPKTPDEPVDLDVHGDDVAALLDEAEEVINSAGPRSWPRSASGAGGAGSPRLAPKGIFRGAGSADSLLLVDRAVGSTSSCRRVGQLRASRGSRCRRRTRRCGATAASPSSTSTRTTPPRRTRPRPGAYRDPIEAALATVPVRGATVVVVNGRIVVRRGQRAGRRHRQCRTIVPSSAR